MKLLSFTKENTGMCIFTGIIIVMLFLLITMSRSAGMSDDEHYHIKQAEYVYAFYTTLGKDTMAVIPMHKDDNLREFGQVSDNIAYLITKILGSDEVMQIRHYVCSIFGWLGILFAALLTFRISKNWGGAIITALLLFFSPRYMGHSFNNLKDVPFAAAMMMGLYYIVLFVQTFPKPSIKICIMLAVSIGLAIGTRIGGLLLIAYFGLFGLLSLFIAIGNLSKADKNSAVKNKKINKAFNPILKLTGKILLYGITTSLAGYIFALLIWPFALIKPIENFIFVFENMSHFKITISQLFEGTLQYSSNLPWYYIPKYILMTVPIAVLIGFVLYPFVGGLKKGHRFTTFIIYFACIFPIFWIIYTGANVYGGWRHVLFAYPPIVAAAGLGFGALMNLFKNRYVKMAFFALPLLLLITPLLHIVRNHPYQYVYFNEVVGGTKNAYGKYELDYYFNSTREATEWIIENAEKDSLVTGDKIKVASWHLAAVDYFLRNDTARFQTVFSRWADRGKSDWDYAVFVITGMPPDQINSKHFPPKNTAHTICVDGKPICLVLKRDDKSDYQAMEYRMKNDADNTITYLEKALEHDPYNDTALIELIEVYYIFGQLDKHQHLLNRAKEYIPKNEKLNLIIAWNHLAKEEYEQAIRISNKAILDNCRAIDFYRVLYGVYMQKKEYSLAEQTILKMFKNDVMEVEDCEQMLEIYKAQGLNDAFAKNKLYKLLQRYWEEKGNKKQAEIFREAAKKAIKEK